jgi:2-(1,2-epoxy-1,2-dihydrophenyl)acetyl-CoA isomerase
MTASPLLKSFDDGVLLLTLNRPEKLNALTWELMRLLNEALSEAAVDPEVRVVVLTGAGRAFCAGGDTRSAEQFDPMDPVSNRLKGTAAWRSLEVRASQVLKLTLSPKLLHSMPKPTIAMLRGPAAGAGLCLAAACDFRVASENAIFTTAFVHAARSGDYGGSYLIQRLVGPAKTRELYFFGDKLNAAEAARIGLVNRVVADDALETDVMAMARRLAEGPPVAYRYIKRNLSAGETLTLDQVIEIETYNMMRCSASDDARELRAAAKESRKPDYKGY